MCQTGFCVNCGTCGVGRIRMDSRGTCADDPWLSDQCDVRDSDDFFGEGHTVGDLDYCACTGDSQCNEACPNFDASQPVTSERVWGRLSEPHCQDSNTCESTQDLCSNGCCGGTFGGCPDGCTGSSVQTINGQRSCTCTGCPTSPPVSLTDADALDVMTANRPLLCATDYTKVVGPQPGSLSWCTSCETCTSLQGDIVRQAPPPPLANWYRHPRTRAPRVGRTTCTATVTALQTGKSSSWSSSKPSSRKAAMALLRPCLPSPSSPSR